jgi:hypothetical protein
VIDKLEALCNVKSPDGEWLRRFDMVEEGESITLKDMGKVGAPWGHPSWGEGGLGFSVRCAAREGALRLGRGLAGCGLAQAPVCSPPNYSASSPPPRARRPPTRAPQKGWQAHQRDLHHRARLRRRERRPGPVRPLRGALPGWGPSGLGVERLRHRALGGAEWGGGARAHGAGPAPRMSASRACSACVQRVRACPRAQRSRVHGAWSSPADAIPHPPSPAPLPAGPPAQASRARS